MKIVRKNCILFLIVILSLSLASALMIQFSLRETFSPDINISFSNVRPFYPVSSWKPETPIYSLGGSVNWYLVSEDPNGNSSRLLNQSSNNGLDGVHVSILKNSANVTRAYMTYSPDNLTSFGPGSYIRFNCDAFADGGQPFGYFMWTLQNNKSVFISLSNVNGGGDSACNVLSSGTFGEKWICLDNFENVCNAAAYSGAQVSITYKNLTDFMVNSSYWQDITSMGFMWQAQSGTGSVEGGDIYNLSILGYIGTDSLPELNLTFETNMVYQDENGTCTFPFNYSVSDPEIPQETLYYSSSNSVTRQVNFFKNYDLSPQTEVFPGIFETTSQPNIQALEPVVVSTSRGQSLCQVDVNQSDTNDYLAQVNAYSDVGVMGMSPVYNVVLNPFCSGQDQRWIVDLTSGYTYPTLRIFLNRVARPHAYVNISLMNSEFQEVVRFRVKVDDDGVTRKYQWLNASGWITIRNETFNPVDPNYPPMSYISPIDWTIDLDQLSFMALCQRTTFYTQWVTTDESCADTQIDLPKNISQNMTIRYLGFSGSPSEFPQKVYPLGVFPSIRGFVVSGSALQPGSWSTTPFKGFVTTNQPGVYGVTLYVTDSFHINQTGQFTTAQASFSCLPSSMGSTEQNARQKNPSPHGLYGFLSFLYNIGGILRRQPNWGVVVGCYGFLYVGLLGFLWSLSSFRDLLGALTEASLFMTFISFMFFPLGYLASSIVILAFSLVPQVLPYFMGRSDSGNNGSGGYD